MKEKLKKWFYEWVNGHTLDLNEEVDIICNIRENKFYKHLSEQQIQSLVSHKIKKMYSKKYPNKKRFSFDNFCKIFNLTTLTTSNMSNKSSIEWLYKELLNSEPNILEWNKLLEQAKEMHKQEIIRAGANHCYPTMEIAIQEAEEYYNVIYKSE